MQPRTAIAGLLDLALLAFIAAAAMFVLRWHRHHPAVLTTRARALWARVGQRWSAHAYLILHLLVGLIVSVLALWGFAALADAVVEREAITEFDITLANVLHADATAFGVRVARLLSDIGSPFAMTVLMGVVAIVLWVRRERLLVTTWLVAFIGGSVLDQALKFAFRRPRPIFPTPLLVARGFSFPSGHAMGSLIGFGLLAYLLARVTPRRALRLTIAAIACALIVGIGISRLYLGAHFFSDVVAGYAAGIVWLAVCVSGADLIAADRAWATARLTAPRG